MHILFSVIVLLFGVAWILHILYMQLLQKYFGYVYFGSQIMAVWYALTEVALWFKFYAFTTLSHQLVMPQCKFYFITCYRRLHFFVKVVPQWLSIMYVYLSGKRKKKKKSIVHACVIIVLFIISSATTLWCLKSELSENMLYTSKLFSLFCGLYFLIMDLAILRISLFSEKQY